MLESVNLARVVAAAPSLASIRADDLVRRGLFASGRDHADHLARNYHMPVHLPAIETASDQWSGRPTPPAAGSR